MDAPSPGHRLPRGHPSILWLGEAGSDDTRLVGGKVANLSRLATLYRVPPGFCLTTRAFASAQGYQAIPARPDPEAPAIPTRLTTALASAYHTLGARLGTEAPSVAVRSSAVDEDGQLASFAGQHETYLNVVGADAVISAVRSCWASLTTQRALEYRRRQGLAIDDARLAVFVQHLVVADVSAVVFSANPVDGNREEIVVNASWGLGESIVGGTVTPDTYRVRKTDLAIVERQIGDKRRMTVAIPGGTREVDVPRLLRGRPVVDDRQIVEMARLARNLEQTMGWPVDVECAIENDHLFLLQCRQITTLRD